MFITIGTREDGTVEYHGPFPRTEDAEDYAASLHSEAYEGRPVKALAVAPLATPVRPGREPEPADCRVCGGDGWLDHDGAGGRCEYCAGTGLEVAR